MLFKPEAVPLAADVYAGELSKVGNWVVAAVRSDVAWPVTVQAIEFGDRV